MQQVKWFDRKFDFGQQQNIFPSILERLEGTPLRLRAKSLIVPALNATRRDGTSWSIKEQMGHLSDLEVLWQGRLQDILTGEQYLRNWDLENKQTGTANHNNRSMQQLLANFTVARAKTIRQLRAITEEQIQRSALHPRLEQPMRVIDLFLFVADHDDHHLATITALIKKFDSWKNPAN